MRTALFTIAAAASAMAFASPAAAQYYYPQPRAYPYGQQYGYGPQYGYGYQHNYGYVRHMQARVDQLQRQIRHFDRRNIISNREARRLYNESRDIERRLRRDARDGRGLTMREAHLLQTRIQRLEYRIHREARNGRYWPPYAYGYRR